MAKIIVQNEDRRNETVVGIVKDILEDKNVKTVINFLTVGIHALKVPFDVL